jgi:hypothetical protein
MELLMSLKAAHLRTACCVGIAALTGFLLTPAVTASAAAASPRSVTSAPVVRQGTLDRTEHLMGDLTVKVYRHGDQDIWYTATIFEGTGQLGSLRAGGAHHAQDIGVFGPAEVTLYDDGTISWASVVRMSGSAGASGSSVNGSSKPQTSVVPRGSVAAGIEEPGEQGDHAVAGVTGGAGAAAVAVGLGLAVRRRRAPVTVES